MCLSQARSGTNYFTSLFKNFDNVLVNYELFSERQPFCEENIYEHLVTTYKFDITNWGLCNKTQFYSNFCQSVKDLYSNSKYEYIFYKIFNEQIDNNLLKSIIKKSEYIIIIKRCHIDTFISLKIALETDKWIFDDVSAVKIAFDIDEYKRYKENIINWWNFVEHLTCNKNTLILTYERDIVSNHLYSQITSFIDGISSSTFSSDVNKQNHSVYADKIINYNDEIDVFIQSEINEYSETQL